MSAKQGNFMGGLNMSFNMYNGGLGSANGDNSLQFEGAISPSFTIGTGQGTSLPNSTFHSNSYTGVNNSFDYSFTSGQNYAFSKRDGFHRVASSGLKIGNFSAMIYNDVIEPSYLLFGGGTDEAWTGGGSFNIGLGGGNLLSIGNDVFTGRRPEDRAKEFDHNKNWYNYVQPSSYDYSLNKGQTFLQFNSFRIQHSGSFDMFTQDLIHGAHTPHFKSSTVNSWQFSFR